MSNKAAAAGIMMLVLALVLPVLVATGVSGTLCPGGEFSCPTHMTCCPLANQHYGCCPFPDATCCSDNVHCCPKDMKCDLVHQTCLKDGSPVKFMWQVKVHAELVSKVDISNNIVDDDQLEFAPPSPVISDQLQDSTVTETNCPDGRHCPGSYTCCRMYRGDYGCCPYQEASCCSDGFHCCPHGAHCDDTTGGCFNEKLNKTEKHTLKRLIPRPKTVKTNAVPVSGGADPAPGVKCPDGHPCPAKSTCCKVPDRGYGCCPYENASCCSDQIHCCPSGTTCNATTAKCDQQSTLTSAPAYSLLTGEFSLAEIREHESSRRVDVNGMCPDRRSQCPDGNTCCKLKNGGYGCCPLPHATCCKDHEHCCPNGYDCVGTECVRKSQERFIADIFLNPIADRVRPEPNHNHHPETEEIESVGDIDCPDHRSECPDGSTCCEMTSGGYGCCFLPEATCCGDKLHCCPHGYWCADEGCERLPSTSENLPSLLNKSIIGKRTKQYHRSHYFVHLP